MLNFQMHGQMMTMLTEMQARLCSFICYLGFLHSSDLAQLPYVEMLCDSE